MVAIIVQFVRFKGVRLQLFDKRWTDLVEFGIMVGSFGFVHKCREVPVFLNEPEERIKYNIWQRPN